MASVFVVAGDVAGFAFLVVASGAAAGSSAVVAARGRLGLEPRSGVAGAAVGNLVVASVAAVVSAVVAAVGC